MRGKNRRTYNDFSPANVLPEAIIPSRSFRMKFPTIKKKKKKTWLPSYLQSAVIIRYTCSVLRCYFFVKYYFIPTTVTCVRGRGARGKQLAEVSACAAPAGGGEHYPEATSLTCINSVIINHEAEIT